MDHLPALLRLINQLFETEKKATRNDALQPIKKNLERMTQALDDMGLRIHNPMGERYDELRTDCEASLAGDPGKQLMITEVLKPIVFEMSSGRPVIVQKAVVIVANDL